MRFPFKVKLIFGIGAITTQAIKLGYSLNYTLLPSWKKPLHFSIRGLRKGSPTTRFELYLNHDLAEGGWRNTPLGCPFEAVGKLNQSWLATS